MIELPPSSFRFGNYGAGVPFEIFMDNAKLLSWLESHVIIGYSRTPEFKTQSGYVAVLIELEDHGEYWSHIPERVFKKLEQ